MRFDIITIFPEFFSGPLDYGIVRRARDVGLIETRIHDLRQFAHDRHRTVDDRPFGGGEGMVMKPEPLFEAVESLLGRREGQPPSAPLREAQGEQGAVPACAVVLLSASGTLFQQGTARQFAALERIVLLCGRYEGVDERVAERLATHEISVGDFVLSGGELPATLVVDAVTRLLPGALGNEASTVHESFSVQPTADCGQAVGTSHLSPVTSHQLPVANYGILDCPQYTRPQDFRGWAVPEVLSSGHHEEIRRWRRKMALAKTLRNRPELLTRVLTEEDARLLEEIRREV